MPSANDNRKSGSKSKTKAADHDTGLTPGGPRPRRLIRKVQGDEVILRDEDGNLIVATDSSKTKGRTEKE